MRDKFKSRLNRLVIYRALRSLPRSDAPKIAAVCFVQSILGFLDLVGIAFIGLLGALAVSGIQSIEPGQSILTVLQFLGIAELPFQSQVAILAVAGASCLLIRTAVSITVTRKLFFFLAHRGALISSNLVAKLLAQNLLGIQARSSQRTLFGLTSGVDGLTLGILGSTITLLADISLLLTLSVGLFLVDPIVALSTTGMFAILGALVYLRLSKRAQNLGKENADLEISSDRQILEVLESYRESVVRNRRGYYSSQIGIERHKLARTKAELKFMPNIGKYVIESSLVVGSLIISGIQFLTEDAVQAVGTLTVFLAAGARIAPAVLRIQNEALSIRASIGSTSATLELMDSLKAIQPVHSSPDQLSMNYNDFSGTIKVSGISLRYPEKSRFALHDVNLEIAQGESVAIVGPSGAGKTSLVDVLLGILPVNSGEVLISGIPTLDAISKWPGAIAYVPQNVTIWDTSLMKNLTVGYPEDFTDVDSIWDALEIAQLSDFVKTLPNGLNTNVGERGAKISGGQRQRLGIARALYTRPKLLILDEATSSLDGQSEFDLSNSIQKLKGSVTVVMIAHRLSSVRFVDKVVYMEDGEIKALGDFNSVRRLIPNFEKQASLMGL